MNWKTIAAIEKELGRWVTEELRPKITALENKQLIWMHSQKSFIRLLLEKYDERQRKGIKVSYNSLFDEMNEEYCRATGEFRYGDFSSFYTVLKRHRKTHAKKSASR